MEDDFEPTPHACREMRRDGITLDMVAVVVGDADDALVQDDGRTAFGRMMDDGRWITVVLEDDARTVVTAWWNRRRSRRDRRP